MMSMSTKDIYLHVGDSTPLANGGHARHDRVAPLTGSSTQLSGAMSKSFTNPMFVHEDSDREAPTALSKAAPPAAQHCEAAMPPPTPGLRPALAPLPTARPPAPGTTSQQLLEPVLVRSRSPRRSVDGTCYNPLTSQRPAAVWSADVLAEPSTSARPRRRSKSHKEGLPPRPR